MSAQDHAFIKAYARELAPKNAAPSGGSAEVARPPAADARTPRAPLITMASTPIECIYAACTLYRNEPPRAAEPEPEPESPPLMASRDCRRLPLRFQLAQMEGEETGLPLAKRRPRIGVQSAAHALQSTRQRQAKTPPPPPVVDTEIAAVDAQAAPAVALSPVASPLVEGPVPNLPLANVVEMSILEVPAEPQPDLVPPQAVADASQTAFSIDVEPPAGTPAPAADEKSAEGATNPTAGSERSVTDVTPPTEATAPSPRERAEPRAKDRLPGSANSDWMRTHGKFIAVAFVFALIATIYLAMNGDEPSPVNPGAASSPNAEAEAKMSGESEPKVTDAHAAKEAIPVIHHHHSQALLDEISSALENPAAEAHAELHAPGNGHTIREPTQSTAVTDSKSLFPWNAAGEARVASKPEGPGAKPQAEPRVNEPKLETNYEAYDGKPTIEEQPSIYGPPGSTHQESAAKPASEGPGRNAPKAYAGSGSNAYRDFEPPQSRTAPVQPRDSWPGATPGLYQPSSQNIDLPSRTSGPRYERTGSGLY